MDLSYLIGKRIKNIRGMTKEEVASLDWPEEAVVIELEGGSKLFASQDEEGNGPGVIFGDDGKNAFALLYGTAGKEGPRHAFLSTF